MTNDHLSQLPSKKFYKSLDDVGNSNDFSAECDQIETDSSSKDGTQKVCYKLANNLSSLEN